MLQIHFSQYFKNVLKSKATFRSNTAMHEKWQLSYSFECGYCVLNCRCGELQKKPHSSHLEKLFNWNHIHATTDSKMDYFVM